jgi:hypothetical protein
VVELDDVVEQGTHGCLVGDVDVGVAPAVDRLTVGDRAAPGGDDVGALRRGRPRGRQPHPAGAADHDDALPGQRHGATSRTALPRTRRPSRAAAASLARSHEPRQPI